MKIIKSFKILVIQILLIALLTGCWDQKIYEQIGFILQVGVEQSKDGQLQITYTSPVTDPKKHEQVELISGDANILRQFREQSRRISAKSLEAGKIQQIVISRSLAEKGINNLLEVFERDPSSPGIAYVVISEDSPKDLFDLAQKIGDKPRPSFYLNQLIQNNSKSGNCPDTTVFEFTRYSFATGIDPICVLVKKEVSDAKGIRVDGSALFCCDKMVGKLNPKDTQLLLLLSKRFRTGEFIFTSLGPPEKDASGKSGASFFITNYKRKIKVTMKDDTPVVNISLSIQGTYDEHQWDRIDKDDTQKKYEEQMSKELKDECMKMLKYTQEVESDPLGIGDIIRARYNSYWSSSNWRNIYKQAEFNIDTKVEILRYGVIK